MEEKDQFHILVYILSCNFKKMPKAIVIYVSLVHAFSYTALFSNLLGFWSHLTSSSGALNFCEVGTSKRAKPPEDSEALQHQRDTYLAVKEP